MESPNYIKYYQTPIGWTEIRSNEEAVTNLVIVDEPGENSETVPAVINECIAQLDEYFMGIRKEFTVSINPVGTPFQERVWAALCRIPYGSIKTYGELSEVVGGRNNTRAVGSAAHYNPILILVPCHRLIGVNGNLTGFAAGLPRKEWLLYHEGYLKSYNSQMPFFS